MMKKQLILGIAAVVVLGAGIGVYAVAGDKKHDNDKQSTVVTKTDESANGMQNMQQGQSSQSGQSGSGAAQGTGTGSSGAGGSSSGTAGNSSNTESTDQIKIANYAFTPAAIKIKVGTKVTWTNADAVKHNIAMDDNADGPSSPMLAKGDTYTYTFTKAGTYHYHCTPHPYMQGTVVVAE